MIISSGIANAVVTDAVIADSVIADMIVADSDRQFQWWPGLFCDGDAQEQF